MGNLLSMLNHCEPEVASIEPLQLQGRLSKRTYRCRSRAQQIYYRPEGSDAHRSCAENPWQTSFLDLPNLVRCAVYAHVLLYDDKIQITTSEVTNVPGLVLLRTCKQLHAEAAAFFYSKNTFHCCIKKIMPAQPASTKNPQCPARRARVDSRNLHDPLNISGGVFFPASRYHEHLTHLTIRLDLTIARFDIASSASPIPTFCKPEADNGMMRTDMEAMHDAIEHRLFRVYQRIKNLWRERDGAWTGTLTIPERTSWTNEMMYEIEFRVREEKRLQQD
jgi:hypothetical protein